MKIFRSIAPILLAAIVFLLVVKIPAHASAQSNLNPIGCMDSPAMNAIVKSKISVKGWFLNEAGVAKIEVLVDKTVAGEASYGDARPDVHRVYPEYSNGEKSGFHFTLDTTKFSDGPHTVSIRETGKNGFVTTIPGHTITIFNSMGFLDNPADGETLVGTKNIRGWFLDESGISSIDVLVDGVPAGKASFGDKRPDVHNVYPEYSNGGNSGYHFALDTTRFSDGMHTISIKETDKNGFVTTLPGHTVRIFNSMGFLDNPVNGETLVGTKNIRGWFLDESGISSIDVLVDGVPAGKASFGDKRPDVHNVYPEYSNGGNSGYHFALDTTRFSDGMHTISIKETGKNGFVTTLPGHTVRIFNSMGFLDNPVNGETLVGTKNIRGWFLDESGISSIDVLVDGVPAGKASFGDKRPDVHNVYPEYSNGRNSGYHFALDTSKFSDGMHTISIKETGKNGFVTTLPGTTVAFENAMGFVDLPVSGTIHSGKNSTVKGWFLDNSGVASIEVLIDGAPAGEASIGDARPDVHKVYPEYKNGKNSGFHFALDTTKYNDGQHKIAIRETGNNGQVNVLPGIPFTIVNVAGVIDTPSSGTTLRGVQDVSGWFLDTNKVKTIEVLVDGAPVGTANYGDARPDVDKVYPDFNNRNAGYHFALDTTKYSNGPHTITIRETSTNGQVTTLPVKQVTMNQSSYVVFLDPGHGGFDPGATGGGYREADLNLSVAKKVQAILESRGYTVYMSRTNNTFIPLLDRSQMANDIHPDVFVSIHHNSTPSGIATSSGIESYFYEFDPAYPSKINAGMDTNPERIAKSMTLASVIQQKLISYTGAVDNGLGRNTFSVLRESAMPATLLELGYINNPNDRKKLVTDSYQNTMARAIADGIGRYFQIY